MTREEEADVVLLHEGRRLHLAQHGPRVPDLASQPEGDGSPVVQIIEDGQGQDEERTGKNL